MQCTKSKHLTISTCRRAHTHTHTCTHARTHADTQKDMNLPASCGLAETSEPDQRRDAVRRTGHQRDAIRRTGRQRDAIRKTRCQRDAISVQRCVQNSSGPNTITLVLLALFPTTTLRACPIAPQPYFTLVQGGRRRLLATRSPSLDGSGTQMRSSPLSLVKTGAKSVDWPGAW